MKPLYLSALTLAAAVTLAFTSPAAAQTPSELCTKANEVVNTLSNMVPIEVDAVTNTTAVVTDCGQTRVQFTRAVDLKLASMEKDFRAFLQKAGQRICVRRRGAEGSRCRRLDGAVFVPVPGRRAGRGRGEVWGVMAMKALAMAVVLFGLATVPAIANTISFHCTFETFSDEKAARQKQDEALVLRYMVDSKSGKAYLIGNLGSSEVSLTIGSLGLTFVERLPTGAVQMTTTNKATNKAVHSRHTLFEDELWPSQFYGSCTVR